MRKIFFLFTLCSATLFEIKETLNVRNEFETHNMMHILKETIARAYHLAHIFVFISSW